ncbi:hypothetical protein [Reyranella soli]|uniref:Uncharacterized protein n=1 Tax=Reyranella soli TaxID=1230389 RepID=A0A512NRL1_9HYPH|nr:hypothetical protein [Reyranella soli]GEP61579.1 hypothetical protein RSO01_87450 [Reyranella soli]
MSISQIAPPAALVLALEMAAERKDALDVRRAPGCRTMALEELDKVKAVLKREALDRSS